MARQFLLTTLALVLLTGRTAHADSRDGSLEIYFIDVEGGAATLIVTPEGESVLIDSGYPDNHGRDLDRIIHVAQDIEHLTQRRRFEVAQVEEVPRAG